MTYNKASLAIIDYKLDEIESKTRYLEKRKIELQVIRDRIIKEIEKEYEPIEPFEELL